MFYISAGIAIIGAVGYQYFVKRIPASLNPIVSIIGMYVAVLALGVILLPLFPAEGGSPASFSPVELDSNCTGFFGHHD